jgi:hypothetical protein
MSKRVFTGRPNLRPVVFRCSLLPPRYSGYCDRAPTLWLQEFFPRLVGSSFCGAIAWSPARPASSASPRPSYLDHLSELWNLFVSKFRHLSLLTGCCFVAAARISCRRRARVLPSLPLWNLTRKHLFRGNQLSVGSSSGDAPIVICPSPLKERCSRMYSAAGF